MAAVALSNVARNPSPVSVRRVGPWTGEHVADQLVVLAQETVEGDPEAHACRRRLDDVGEQDDGRAPTTSPCQPPTMLRSADPPGQEEVGDAARRHERRAAGTLVARRAGRWSP